MSLRRDSVDKWLNWLIAACFIVMALVWLAPFVMGYSSEGGGYSTFIKTDFIAGNTTDSRVGGGHLPVSSFGDNTTVYCGRLGILDPVKCLTTPVAPSNVSIAGGEYKCDDFMLASNKVGLRRLNWLKRGIALNAGLPEED